MAQPADSAEADPPPAVDMPPSDEDVHASAMSEDGVSTAEHEFLEMPDPAEDPSLASERLGLRARLASVFSFLAQDASPDPESDREWTHATPDDASSISSDFPTAEHVARSVGRWEDDCDVAACHKCTRRFTFFLRKHHCRRCGRIFCDACTSQRVHLPVQDLVIDPAVPEMLRGERLGPSRVCDWCVDTYALVPDERSSAGDLSLWETIGLVRPRDEAAERSLPSHTSGLEECPVCFCTLSALAPLEVREAHIRHCLEHGAPAHAPRRTRYVVSRLTPDSVLLGTECIICMEEFVVNDRIARLNCLCCFHHACIAAWLQKSHGCPTHAVAH